MNVSNFEKITFVIKLMKKNHSIIQVGICITIFLFSLWAKSADARSGLSVNFHYNNDTYEISGKKINEYTYIFNQGAPRKIKITTLDWPPYIGKDLCKQGWVQQLTIAMLASQGYEIVCTFYPWARAVATVESGDTDILYPEYFIETEAPSDVYKGTRRLDHLAISKKIPGGPIAFIKRKDEKDNYNGNLFNLQGTAIGVVRGYQNTPEFDTLMDLNFFNTYEVTNDLINIKMLIAGRVDLIIGDPAVIYYSVKDSDWAADEKAQRLNALETVKPVIQYNHLYYAVSKKQPEWEQTLEMLNRTIAEFEKSGELFNIIQRTNSGCGFILETLPQTTDVPQPGK